MANILEITYADFSKGKWELANGMYEQPKINEYIDLYTHKYLAEMLGVELLDLFAQDLVAGVPQAQIYLNIYNQFTVDPTGCSILISDGMVNMIKGFIYFEYLKDQINQVWVSGNVQPVGENSKNVSTLSQQIYTRYNQSVDTYRAIQQYMCDNSNEYPTYNGIHKYTTYWI